MHKGIILIVKAHNRKHAVTEAKEFLEEYKDDVWDWYQIGGRWQGHLAPMRKEFMEASKVLLPPNDRGFISQQQVDNAQIELQQEWERIGGEGPNPYSDHYGMPEDGRTYDVMPLPQCMDIVAEWQQTVETAQKEEERAKRWLAEDPPDYRMYGYSLKCAANLYQQDFCFDCNIFNIEEWNYSIPEENQEDYWCVMVDIHN